MKNRICTKFAFCKLVANINVAKVCTHCVSLWKLGNHHFCNGCKLIQSRSLQQVCTRQTFCKFDFSSSDYYRYKPTCNSIHCCLLSSNTFFESLRMASSLILEIRNDSFSVFKSFSNSSTFAVKKQLLREVQLQSSPALWMPHYYGHPAIKDTL